MIRIDPWCPKGIATKAQDSSPVKMRTMRHAVDMAMGTSDGCKSCCKHVEGGLRILQGNCRCKARWFNVRLAATTFFWQLKAVVGSWNSLHWADAILNFIREHTRLAGWGFPNIGVPSRSIRCPELGEAAAPSSPVTSVENHGLIIKAACKRQSLQHCLIPVYCMAGRAQHRKDNMRRSASRPNSVTIGAVISGWQTQFCSELTHAGSSGNASKGLQLQEPKHSLVQHC